MVRGPCVYRTLLPTWEGAQQTLQALAYQVLGSRGNVRLLPFVVLCPRLLSICSVPDAVLDVKRGQTGAGWLLPVSAT